MPSGHVGRYTVVLSEVIYLLAVLFYTDEFFIFILLCLLSFYPVYAVYIPVRLYMVVPHILLSQDSILVGSHNPPHAIRHMYARYSHGGHPDGVR